MGPLIHTLTHLHGDLPTPRLLLQLLEDLTTPGTPVHLAYARTETTLTYAIPHVHRLLELLQEDEHPGPTPTETSPTECPTTCPRPSSPSSTSPSSSPSPPSPPPSSPTSAATDTADTSPPCL